MTVATHRPHVAVLTNLLAPYRVPVLEGLASEFNVTVVYQGEPSDRSKWQEWTGGVARVHLKPSASIRVEYTRRIDGEALDRRFFHIPYGLLLDLVRLRPDSIITIEMGARTWIARIYGWLFRKPVWVWWGGTLYTERELGRTRRLSRWLLARLASRWISYGRSSTEYLLAIGVPRNRILQIQNCVDERLFEQSTEKADRKDRVSILTIGQLVRRKGIDLLLESASRLQHDGLEFELVIVGDGPERAALENQAKKSGAHNVRFIGAVKPDIVPRYYHRSDGFVFPTLEDVWGLVVNEALWSGLPVIASKYAGCATELLHEDSIFDPLTPEDIDRALRSLVEGRVPSGPAASLFRVSDVVALIAEDIHASLGQDSKSSVAVD